MRKSILGVCGTVAVLALLFCEKSHMPETTEEKANTAGNITYPVESVSLAENEHEIVKAAEFPQEGSTIVIEDDEVPLAAMPTAKEQGIETEGKMSFDGQSKSSDSDAEDVKTDQAESKTPVPVKKEAAVKKTESAKQQAPVTFKTGNAEQESKLEDLGGGVCGYYDEEASEALLAQINTMRSGAPSAGTLSAELNDIARRRALSCVKEFSHNGMETASECIAIGQADAAGVVTSWYASDDHRTYMSDPAYTQAGAACIRYDKGNGQMQTIWVLVLN